jgi:DNA-binding GntR family transcriptional regulator
MEMSSSSRKPGPIRERHTLAEIAALEILDRIMRGDFPPGSPLRLAELASELQMSHMPVREGLQRLGALGIVEIVPHKGARVRELSLDDFDDTQSTRLSLESIAIEKAATRFSEQDVAAARSALDETVERAREGDALEARQAHAAFHFALYRASGSRWLVRAIEPVWENSERYRFSGPTSAERVLQSHVEHQAILDGCVARDPAAAVAALRAHLTSAATRIRTNVKARIAAQEPSS